MEVTGFRVFLGFLEDYDIRNIQEKNLKKTFKADMLSLNFAKAAVRPGIYFSTDFFLTINFGLIVPNQR